MSELSEAGHLNLSGQNRDCMVLRVEGMTCGHCANAVQSELASVPGVIGTEVDLGSGTARVTGNAEVADFEAAVERAGYKVTDAGAATRPDIAQPRGCGSDC